MLRVHVICEGQTEEMFVNELLQPVFLKRKIHLIPSLVGKPGHKGGNFKFERLYPDVRNRLLADSSCYCTSFFDFYGLPSQFPGKAEAEKQGDISEKAKIIENAMVAALEKKINADAMRRFIPFIQMYEFEALLFSDPAAFAKGIGKEKLESDFQRIMAEFLTPEHINDSPQTAPSKRVVQLIPGYEKPVMGNLAAIEVGLSAIREKCHLFNAWLERLEDLVA